MSTKNNTFLLSIVLGILFSNVLIGQNAKTVFDKNEFSAGQALFTAGQDASICSEDEFITEGRNNSCAISMWQSNGDGFFENSNDPETTYIPGEQDIINGKVTLSLFIFPLGGGGIELIYDDMQLYIGKCTASNQL